MNNIIDAFQDVSASLVYTNGRYKLHTRGMFNMSAVSDIPEMKVGESINLSEFPSEEETFIPISKQDLDRVLSGPCKLVFASESDIHMKTVTSFDCKTDITFKDVIDMIEKSEMNIRKPHGEVWYEDHTFFQGGSLYESEEHGKVIMWSWGS